uniref:Integrase catalytic domain-containing protein n=1 Tax=Chenopodium quinoa TaxID=63459 RepID=A0A803MIW3_CHEQI
MHLSQFELTYVPQKDVKGQALVDFLADHPPMENVMVQEEKPWTMFFDGSSRRKSVGAGIVICSPSGVVTKMAIIFSTQCTNNIAEFEAFVIGLRTLKDMGVTRVKVLVSYIPREENKEADFLAQQESLPNYEGFDESVIHINIYKLKPLDEKVKAEVHKYNILTQDTDCRKEIKEYLNDPSRGKVLAKVRLAAIKYFLMGMDQATMFTGHEFNSYLKEFEIQKIYSTPYFSQANGQVEATNKNIKKRCNWDYPLPIGIWA